MEVLTLIFVLSVFIATFHFELEHTVRPTCVYTVHVHCIIVQLKFQ